jgi:hypothetical protein
MLAIDLARKARRLPLVILIGLVLMAAGALLDVAIQLGTASHHAHHEGFGRAHVGHLVAIAGMVLVLVGVVAHGVRSHRRPGAATHGGLAHDAHR